MKRRTLPPDELADLLRLFQWLHDNPPSLYGPFTASRNSFYGFRKPTTKQR
jgi:hypothetical protein